MSFDCRGEILRQNNSVCALGTYQGGYRCCEGGMVLLDADQVRATGVVGEGGGGRDDVVERLHWSVG